MADCTRVHPPNVVCLDRNCVWGVQNPYVRMQRTIDRLYSDNRKLKQLWEKRPKPLGDLFGN